MTKKEYLLAFLERMSPDNDIALAMLTIMKNTDVSELMMDQLYSIVHESIKTAINDEDKQKFMNLQEVIQKIKNTEINQDNSSELDAMLASI